MDTCLSISSGNERAILLFLFFESVVLLVLAVLVRFCCIFWRKKKLQGQHLGNFLEKRRSLQLKKKAFDRSITELEKKVAEDAVANEVIEKFSSLVRERRSVERKLSTTYSLGRDEAAASSESKSLPPVYDAKSRSYSFQGAKKESVTIFHTLSATSSAEGSSEREASWVSEDKDQSTAKAKAKAKAKAPIKAESSSDGDGIMDKEYRRSPSEPASSSRGFINPLLLKQEKLQDKGEVVESMSSSIRSMPLLKRRRTLSSTN